MKKILLLTLLAVNTVYGQYAVDRFTATTNEVNDGLNQTKPVTPWTLKNWVGGGGNPNAVTNSQTNVTLSGAFTETGGGNVVTTGSYAKLAGINADAGDGALLIGPDGINAAGANITASSFDTSALKIGGDIYSRMLWTSLGGQFIDAEDGGVIRISNGGTGGQIYLDGPVTAESFTGPLQSTNLVGVLPMGTLTTGTIVTNGFLTTDGTNRSYSKNAQYLTNVQDSALSTNVALLNANQNWRGTNTFFVGAGSYLIITNGNNSSQLLVQDATAGISINGDYPGFGVNAYYDGSWRAIGSGYCGKFQENPSTGDWVFTTGNNPGKGNIVTLTDRFAIRQSGSVQSIAPFYCSSTITVTNGYVFPPKSSATTYAQLGTSNTVVFYGDNAIPQTIYARSFNAQSNAVDVPFISMAPRWIDAPGQIIPLAVGNGALTIADMGDGIFGYQFDRIFGANAYGTQKLPFNSEAPHNLYQTNAYYLLSNTNLYIEPHFHGRPLIAPVAPNTNISFQVVWKACTPPLAPSQAFTNTVTYGLTAGSTNEMLIEFTHTPYATNQPSIATVWPATITVINPGSNSYMEQAGAAFIIRQPSFHVPVSSFHGSTTDATQ